ncbi:hypothetical protein RUND412_010054 [Rhizina undulata]
MYIRVDPRFLLAVLLCLLLAVSSANAQYITPATLSLPTSITSNISAAVNYDYLCPDLRYHNCAIIGHVEACCDLDSVCALDDRGDVACCPFRTTCVGSLKSSGASASGGMAGLLARAAVAAVVLVGECVF